MTPDKEKPFKTRLLETESKDVIHSRKWMLRRPKAQPDKLSANQLTSLSAMIAYTASKSGQSEYRVERALADSFNIANSKFLPANDFDAAIRYLADIIQL